MTATDASTETAEAPGRFWFIRRIAPYLRIVILGMLPCPDPFSRYRMRRAARRLVTLRTWPGMDATSEQAAQLAMLRLLSLQRQARRAVRGRHREAAAMLARASVEALLLGLYCMRVPEAVARLHAGNIKALGDGMAYLEEIDIAPAEVIRQSAARLGEPSRRHLTAWDLAEAIDKANGNKSARSIYRRLYVPLSNFTVHASGGTLLRHVGRNGKLVRRPSRSWNRRSPARVADAAAGLLAADLAQHAGAPHEKLAAYADKHLDRTLMPMAVMAFTGTGGSARIRSVRETARIAREVFTYLWHGAAAADPPDIRTEHVRERFAAMLHAGESDIPEGALDPLIDHLAEKLARRVPGNPVPDENATPATETGKTGTDD